MILLPDSLVFGEAGATPTHAMRTEQYVFYKVGAKPIPAWGAK